MTDSLRGKVAIVTGEWKLVEDSSDGHRSEENTFFECPAPLKTGKNVRKKCHHGITPLHLQPGHQWVLGMTNDSDIDFNTKIAPNLHIYKVVEFVRMSLTSAHRFRS